MKTPMELLKEFAPEFAQNQMDEKALLFEHPGYQAVPAKYKLLIGIATAAISGSDTCTQMWVKMAKDKGVTNEEIIEAIMVARYMKQATVNDTASNAFAYYQLTGEVRDMSKRKVLFLCTGNSCRSQLAEAIVNARLGETWEAVSAGTKPAGYVHPKALAALAEIGIQHQGRSKLADEFKGVDFDLVVTVCNSAAEECPIWLGKGKRVHHSFPDPAKTDDMNDFRKVRDDIEREIIALLENYA